jgi:hypothetical protein
MRVTISHLSEQVGEDALGRPKMSRAPRVEGRLWLPEKHRDLVRMCLAMKLPYSVELICTSEGRYSVHLTFDLGKATASSTSGYPNLHTLPASGATT